MLKTLSKRIIVKKCYPFCLVTVFLSFPIIMWIRGISRGWIAIVVASEVGVAAMMQSQIARCFLMPILRPVIKEVTTRTQREAHQKWYNLSIKNYGYSPARNLRVKIRDEENKSWVNLVLPFKDLLEKEGLSTTVIPSLSVQEENDFNIGHIEKEKDQFKLALNIDPISQKTVIAKDEEKTYFLEIVANNSRPYQFKIKITNRRYEEFNLSKIKIL